MIELNAGDLAATLDPETGGAIAAFTCRGEPLLRPVADPRLAAQHGRAVAAYPLIPFANRVAWGRFTWDGASHQLARNFGDHPHTIHGNAWMRPWTVAERAAAHARITLDHAPPRDPPEQWPFAYRAEQVFALTPGGLDVTLSVQNRDARAWPAGLGLHPYVARKPGATLRFAASALWTTGMDSLPDQRLPPTGDQDFASTRPLGTAEIDACYAGWSGTAELTVPGYPGLCLQAQAPLTHLQLYTPAGRDYLGLEPVANMPDAINRIGATNDAGLHVLRPGESLRATIHLAVTGCGPEAEARARQPA